MNTIKFFKISLALLLGMAIVKPGQANNSLIDKGSSRYVAAGPSHSLWDNLLKKYVSSSGTVNYKGFKADEASLNNYLKLLEKQAPAASWSRNETMAYWINAYNAYTVKLILNNYPISSITKLDNGKPWDKKFINIAGKSYSLNDIEHKILRPTFKDPRIHFAVNCASASCPKLLNEAFTAEKLQAQLNKQTRSYINNSRHNKIAANSLQVSQIFNWYGKDFEASGGVASFFNKYTKTEIAKDAEVSFLKYDWSLNE